MDEPMYLEVDEGVPRGTALKRSFLAKRFPDHDFALGPPAGFAAYRPTPHPPLKRFEKLVIRAVRWEGDHFRDDIEVRPMTDDERAIEAAIIERNFHLATGNASWRYDPATDRFLAPQPVPDAVHGGVYRWLEAQQRWELIDIKEM